MDLVTKTMKVLILCGGKGERLRPLTNNIPKPMITIKDEPILFYIIKHLKTYDLNNFIFATGYKSNIIHEYLDRYNKDLIFETIDSGDVDIIKRIQDASEYIRSDFLVLYGDTISDIDINDLIKNHQSHNQPVTMTVWPLKSQFGLVDIDQNGKVLSFQEKPILDKWINIGYFYFNFEMLESINKYQRFDVFLKDISEKGILNAFRHPGVHITVNTVEELKEAEKSVIKIIKKVTHE